MNKNNFSTVIDYGSSKLRLGVFNENIENSYISSKKINEKNNYEEHFNLIKFLIKDAEKKISNHLDNVTVLYDSPEIYSIDLSIKKKFDQKISTKEIYFSIILEANQIIKNNYTDKKIIHVISTNIVIDGKKLKKNLDNNIKAKSIILEMKFICLPSEKFNNILSVFKKNNLEVLNLFCSSYVKSLSYINFFNEHEFLGFIDIGYEKSTFLLFHDNRLIFIKGIPIGGNHITKDISKVMMLDINDSENIKKYFNKSENEFSHDEDFNENKVLISEILDKDISVSKLKKVILSRVEEIFDLIFKDLVIFNLPNKNLNFPLILIGNGSKLLDKNIFHLNKEFNFKDIIFFNETDLGICEAAINSEVNLKKSDIKITQKNAKKYGIFEKFFYFFSK